MRLLVLLSALLLPELAHAVCGSVFTDTDGVPARNAASASPTEISLCVTASATGTLSRIYVPAGSGSGTVTLPANKDLDIVGATVVTCTGTAGSAGYVCAPGGTATTLTGSPAFAIHLGANHTISGFTITGGAGERISCNSGGQAANKHFRIHHNVLISTAGWQPIRCDGFDGLHPQGIWDHNRFQNGVAIHTNGAVGSGQMSVQNAIWNRATTLGDTTEVVYLEDNYFVNAAGITNYTDGNYAARSVIRFNTTDGGSITGFEYHSPQGLNRGYQRWENYHNTLQNLGAAGTCFFGMSLIRGGTGVWFNNTATGASFTADCNNDVLLDNVRSSWTGPVDGIGPCDGGSNWDQNTTGQQGRHCRDQIGIGRDLTLWNHSPVSAWNQELKPAYLWGNTKPGGQANPTVDTDPLNPTHIINNSDFYKDVGAACSGASCSTGVGAGVLASRPANCTAGVAWWATDQGGNWNTINATANDGALYKCTATNTWTLYYTPHQYPHEWTQSGAPSDITPPSAPTNLRLVSLSQKTINIAWDASTDDTAVTGYFIEHCAGVSCSGYTQVGFTTAALAYSDGALLVSTSYTLRVRATDAAGNLGAYSNTLTAVTPFVPFHPTINLRRVRYGPFAQEETYEAVD